MPIPALLTPKNYLLIIARADIKTNNLYIALNPFDDSVGAKAEFVSSGIGEKVLKSDGPMLIFEDENLFNSVKRILSGEEYHGSRYFVPTFPGSSNPIHGSGAVFAYIDHFHPKYARIFDARYASPWARWLENQNPNRTSISVEKIGDNNARC